MKKASLLLAATALGAAASAMAQAPSPITGNLTIASDYRFRGISQTFKGPAIQGGIDYAHPSGLYLGNWNSNVSGLSYPNGAGIEMDFYGGYKGSFGAFGYDVGLLQYYYPNARVVNAAGSTKFDTLEAYGGVTWQFLTLKYSHTLTDFFGVKSATFGGACNRDGVDCFGLNPGDSRGSGYLDLSASFEVAPKLTLAAHIGRQRVKNFSKLDYSDYKVGLTYDLNGWLLGGALVGANADEKWYFVTDGGGRTRETGKTTIVLSVGKTF